MIYLMKGAEKIITDSGGMQKESYLLDTPCVTVRDQTEWTETLAGGYNVLAQPEYDDLLIKLKKAKIDRKYIKKDFYGNGDAAGKILEIIERLFS